MPLCPICPICKREPMEFACRIQHVEIYGCKHCGSTLSVPDAKES